MGKQDISSSTLWLLVRIVPLSSMRQFLHPRWELYRRILGIESPWQVERVELKLELGEIHVDLEREQDVSWACPECSAPSPLYDHQPERGWRHLDTCQYQTFCTPVRRAPNAGCMGEAGEITLGEAGARFTALFEALAIA